MKTLKYIAFVLLTCFFVACEKENEIVPVQETVLLTQNVSGSVFLDTDRDEIGDVPLEGARVYLGDFLLINDIRSQRPDTLEAPYDEILWSDVDANGNYEMNAVLEMEDMSLVVYTEDIKGIFGTDTTPDGDYLETEVFGIIPITVEENETDDGNNFVIQLIEFGEISGNIKIDNDKDGLIDGPVEGAKLWLSRQSETSGGPIGLALDNVYTDANGNYTFEKVKEGKYVVSFADVTEYFVLTGIDESPDSDPTHPIKEFLPVNLVEGEVDSDNNFKVVPIWYNVTGVVSEDTTGDGNGDTPLFGQTVELYLRDSNGLPSGSRVSWGLTDHSGVFKFRDRAVGEYVIKLADLNGYDCVSGTDLTPEVNEPIVNPSCDLIQTNVSALDSNDSDNVFVIKSK